MFYVGSLSLGEVQDLGLEVVKRRPDTNQLHGWAVLEESAIAKAELQVIRDDSPPRHANVIGWPQDAAQRRLKAQLLASKATSVPVNPPITVTSS